MSGSGTPSPSTLKHLLIEEAARLRDFLVLLEKEQQALADGDVERLMPIAAEKTELFGRLAQLGESRGRALAAEGLAADRQGMESWLGRHPDQAGAKQDWLALLAMAEKARALNQTNGKLIATRLAHNQQALATLMNAANQASLYGPDGQARPVGGGRSLGSV